MGFGLTSTVGIASAAIALFFGYRLAYRRGHRDGFEAGISDGCSAAVFSSHGVSPDGIEAFWKHFHQADEAKGVHEFHEQRAKLKK